MRRICMGRHSSLDVIKPIKLTLTKADVTCEKCKKIINANISKSWGMP
jgi:hypothetical protein